MFQFNLFGGFRVTNNQSIAATTLGRKSECLLCFLALAQGMNSTREKAAGLIWSDRSDDQARASLRQELSQLRRVLGQDVIEANKQSIWLVPEFVSIDVREFRAAIRKDTPEHLKTAGALYAGPLFDGHHSKSDGFEGWITTERNILIPIPQMNLIFHAATA